MLRLLVAVTVLCVFFSCKKNKEDEPPIVSPVVGFWQFTGSPAVDGRFLNFVEDGTLEFRHWDTVQTTPYTRFAILSDSTMQLSKANATPVIVKYSFKDQLLLLSGACFQECEEKYGRVLIY